MVMMICYWTMYTNRLIPIPFVATIITLLLFYAVTRSNSPFLSATRIIREQWLIILLTTHSQKSCDELSTFSEEVVLAKRRLALQFRYMKERLFAETTYCVCKSHGNANKFSLTFSKDVDTHTRIMLPKSLSDK
jgi:hypothetical protein